MPVPMSGRLWGVRLASSATSSVALRSPTPAGVKVRLMLQLPKGVTVAPAQVSVSAHSVGCAPPSVSVPRCRSAVPMLVSETSCGALVVVFTWVTAT